VIAKRRRERLKVIGGGRSKVAFTKLYDRKTPSVADLLNDRVLTFFGEHEIPLPRVLTDRRTKYCGADGHGNGSPP
jgi:hypothetical protein